MGSYMGFMQHLHILAGHFHGQVLCRIAENETVLPLTIKATDEHLLDTTNVDLFHTSLGVNLTGIQLKMLYLLNFIGRF